MCYGIIKFKKETTLIVLSEKNNGNQDVRH